MADVISTLRAWMQEASAAEKRELARRANTSVAYLGHLSTPETRKEHREPNPTTAIAIEHATKALARDTKGRLPIVWRTELNQHCRGCDLARKAFGEERITASHFPVVNSPAAVSDSEGGEAD